MAKITAEQLKDLDYDGWQKFGNRLGWTIVSCQDDHAAFLIRHSTHKISQFMREDIERTWREQDKPALKEVANG